MHKNFQKIIYLLTIDRFYETFSCEVQRIFGMTSWWHNWGKRLLKSTCTYHKISLNPCFGQKETYILFSSDGSDCSISQTSWTDHNLSSKKKSSLFTCQISKSTTMKHDSPRKILHLHSSFNNHYKIDLLQSKLSDMYNIE